MWERYECWEGKEGWCIHVGRVGPMSTVRMVGKRGGCGGTGTETTVPTNTVHVPITTGTVTDSGSECTDFIGW